MTRETAAQKRRRIADLLAAYDETVRAKRKLEADEKTMKAQIRELQPGTYDDWSYEYGTPREILDQPQVARDYAARGEQPPKVTTQAPIVVKHVGATKTSGSRRRT
jgi:hypothetical protein